MADAADGYQQQHSGGYENGAGANAHHQQQQQSEPAGGGAASSAGGAGGAAPHHTQIDQTHKIFVGGVAWQSTEDSLRSHFGSYGELLDVALMRDRQTGAPRGFGFVTFKRGEGACLLIEMSIEMVGGLGLWIDWVLKGGLSLVD